MTARISQAGVSRLLCLRHGESENVTGQRQAGALPSAPLTPKGKEQASAAAAELRAGDTRLIKAVYASDTATVNNPSYTEGSVVLWNTATRKPRATLTDPGGHGSGTPGAFTKDGTILAVADSNGEIYLWNPNTAKLIGVIPNPDSQSGQSANWLAFSPRTGYLAAGDGDGTTYLWNIQTRKLVKTFQDPDTHNGINTIAFSPDGTTLATGDGNGNVYLWNVATGALTATLRSPSGDAIGGVAFSSTDGALAVTANNAKGTQNSIYIWNAAHELVATFHDPNSEAAYRLAFSPDGRYLAAADANAHTYLWDMTWLNP
jgi:WD40 repeat protein